MFQSQGTASAVSAGQARGEWKKIECSEVNSVQRFVGWEY